LVSVNAFAAYPSSNSARDRWILAQRGPKNSLDPWRPYAYLHEEETGPNGELIPTSTIFLTNKECPYRCLMCDLWQNTLNDISPLGAITAQIRYALERLPPARQVKLYNAGSFFDPRAITPEEYDGIAVEISHIERVVVECHPALVNEKNLAFAKRLNGRFEVAMGLETAHQEVLARLNKRMTRESFADAAKVLRRNGIDVRVFILVRPPYLSEAEGRDWACKSLDFAFECGAAVCSLLPTRAGNGALEALAKIGEFSPPSLTSVEHAMEYGLALKAGRVFTDMWDVEKFYTCRCSAKRAARLMEMNITQRMAVQVQCENCGSPHN
jgi:radical SAM enzyme (TIGR01210 family)